MHTPLTEARAYAPESESANPQAPKPIDKRKEAAQKRPKREDKYGCRINVWITVEMAKAIARLSGNGVLFSEADAIRLIMHSHLMASDPRYAQTIEATQFNRPNGNTNEQSNA
jgi:hypothetical protein